MVMMMKMNWKKTKKNMMMMMIIDDDVHLVQRAQL